VQAPLEALPHVGGQRGTRSTLSSDGTNAPAISRRRLIAGLTLAAVELPVMTLALTTARSHLGLTDEALVYLLGVILVTIVGGFWPAVLASLAAGLLLNWFFTEPVHTWTIDAPQNILALLLFVVVAVTVSSVVHLAARRSALASERASDANTMLSLARTVHSGDDSPQTIIDHLAASLLRARLARARPSFFRPVRICASPCGETWPGSAASYSTATRPRRQRLSNGIDCAFRPARQKPSPRATGCARPCWPQSDTTCVHRWLR
jgi:hypothetical protein